jgi:microcystin-dependent protein
MTASIEIFENTLLKLIVRQGIDSDRKNIVLDSGELAYTTDTERLYVGDGSTFGGVPVGNKFLGSAANIVSFANATIGDIAYQTSTSTLYACIDTPPTISSSWLDIGRVIKAGQSITMTSTGTLSLCSERIKTNNISPNNSEYLGLDSHPVSLNGKLKIKNIVYQFPAGGLESFKFLMTDALGNLSWSSPIQNSTYFVSNTANMIPVGTIVPFVSGASMPSGWLMCNGQSISTSTYSELFSAIRYSYGGSGANFNIPNLTNRVLYGTTSTTHDSTTYEMSTASGAPLSAVGMIYMIKAIPEKIATSTLTVNNPLTASVNGINVTGTSVSTLCGNINVGLSALYTNNQEAVGTFYVDTYGRVYDIETAENVINLAGTVSEEPSVNNTQIYNYTSPIAFLKNPVTLCDTSRSSTLSRLLTTINVYPIITNISGFPVSPNRNVPAHAKNVILDATIEKTGPDGTNIDRYVTAAPNITVMNPISSTTVGTGEYLIIASRASGNADQVRSASQVIIPLSASGANLSFGLRFSPSFYDAIRIRVIGYTL